MKRIRLWVKAGLNAANTMLEKGLSLYSQEDRDIIKGSIQTAILANFVLAVGVAGLWYKISHPTLLGGAASFVALSVAIVCWHWAQIHWRIAKSLRLQRPKKVSLYTKEERYKIELYGLLLISFTVLGVATALVSLKWKELIGMTYICIAYTVFFLFYVLRAWLKARWRIAKSLIPNRPFWTRDERFGVWLSFAVSLLTGAIWYLVGASAPMIVKVIAVLAGVAFLSATILYTIRGVRRWRQTWRSNLPPDPE